MRCNGNGHDRWYTCREHPQSNGVLGVEKYRVDVGPSHLFKAYWDALTGKRDLQYH